MATGPYEPGYNWWGTPLYAATHGDGTIRNNYLFYFGDQNTPNSPLIDYHADLLTKAGVDFISIDFTNGAIDQITRGAQALCNRYVQRLQAGLPTPRIAFFVNNTATLQTVKNTFYNVYPSSLFFYYEGKPLAEVAQPNTALGAGDRNQPYTPTGGIFDSFTCRHCWGLDNSGSFWQFKTSASTPPPAAYYNGVPEEMCASGACQSSYMTLDGINPGPGAQGRSNGAFFRTYMAAVQRVKPTFTFITGWNEWAAINFNTLPAGKFVDQWREGYSSDFEPEAASDPGSHGSQYYDLMAQQIAILKATLVPAFANGSFEAPSVGSASYQYNPTGGNWTFSGYSGIQSNSSAFGAANAPDGTQTAFLQSYFGQGALGSISQSINFASAGTYMLTFQAARRQGQVQPLRFSVDGVPVGGLLTPSGSSFAPLTTGTFAISSPGAHTLTLSATDNSGDNSIFIDQVTVVPTLLPTIANGSFETPSVGSASYQYNPTGGSWSFTGYSGIQSNGSLFGAPSAPGGSQTAFLQGYPGPSELGSISQSVTFSATGNFALTFQAARRAGQVQPLRFSVDGVQIGGLLSASGNSFGLLTSATFSIGTAGPHTLTLTLSATDNSGDLSAFVDMVSLISK